jgi:hypothetical protein
VRAFVRKYSRLEHILASARGVNYERIWCVMFTAYIDDSGTSPDLSVAVAGAWIAPFTEWKRFESEWKRAMEKEGFSCFHSSECAAKNRKSEFANWDTAKQQRVFGRLRQVVKKFASKGMAFGVSKRDYDEVVVSGDRKILGQDHYVFALRSLFGVIEKWRAKRRINDRLEYVFDWIEPRDKRRKEIELTMHQMEQTDNALARYGYYDGCYSFRKRCDVIPLQAADLLAWSHFQNAQQEFINKPASQIAVDTLNRVHQVPQWRMARIRHR